MEEAKTITTAALVSLTMCLTALGLFWGLFHTDVGDAAKVCERHGWAIEGAGPYQAKHCVDPHTRAMYLAPELAR